MKTVLQLPRGFTLTLASGGDGYSAYTVAKIDPPLPVAFARRLADAQHPLLPRSTRDTLPAERVGEVIRAHGADGLTGAELETYQQGAPVGDWHVDVPEGVGVLVAWLFTSLNEGDLDADDARALHREHVTNSVLLTLEKLDGKCAMARMVLDRYFDAKVNADDPRWIALKARFRAELGSVA